MSKHKIVHIEIPAIDPKIGGKFYQDAFDWELEEYPELDYVVFSAGD